ncbi:MAG: secretin and TonB N-terminal domain-containing protein, partial [Kiritimatiellales bacterium]|nr:secretin and TonB N-terminal domain-containing protein [Kiritimatiellales bacterium]
MKSRGKGSRYGTMILLAGLSVGIFTIHASVYAQTKDQAVGSAQFIEPDSEVEDSEYVTINVKDVNIAEVLKAYSLQTGQSIVVGPDVIAESVNVRLNNIPWQDALDVILKPYGFGYTKVGDTIMVRKLENIMTVEEIEPLTSRVIRLKYLDAYDVKAVCEAQLTSRGKFTILETKGLPGWKFGSSGDNARRSSGKTAASSLGIQEQAKKKDLEKSKTIVVTDVPSAVAAVEAVIESLDQIPSQVLIEARFLEIGTDALKDIGLDFITGLEEVSGSATTLGGTPSIDDMANILTLLQGYPDPLSMGAAGTYGMDNGLRLSHTKLGESGVEVLINLIQTDEDANILSAPRIL